MFDNSWHLKEDNPFVLGDDELPLQEKPEVEPERKWPRLENLCFKIGYAIGKVWYP